MADVFRFFDRDGSGCISPYDFRDACEILNQTLSTEEKITDYDDILKILDVSGEGSVDLNEFFEMFRISDMKSNYHLSEALSGIAGGGGDGGSAGKNKMRYV